MHLHIRETIRNLDKMASAASSEAQAPVIFENFGMIPDVRLKVFDLEIQVHSGVLKEHSAFFRRFLDPANKEEESSVASGPFKYEWISKVDEDGSWGLVSVGSGDVSCSGVSLANPA